jgi:hypothetical protein
MTPHDSACLLGMVNRSTREETRMNHPCCPHPIGVQRLYSGPVGAPIDTWAQQLLTQGYASWTAQSTMRLRADFSRWLQRQTLTAADLHDQRVDEFLHDRYQCYRAHRDDRPILRRVREHLREQGLMPARVVDTRMGPHDRMARDFRHYLRQQRGLAPSTVQDYLTTVRRFLSARFGAHPLRLAALGPQASTAFMVQQTRRDSPARAQWLATARRSFCRFVLQRGAIAPDLAHAVPTGPHWRVSGRPRLMPAEDVDHL